jgi:hypothetical protein
LARRGFGLPLTGEAAARFQQTKPEETYKGRKEQICVDANRILFNK